MDASRNRRNAVAWGKGVAITVLLSGFGGGARLGVGAAEGAVGGFGTGGAARALAPDDEDEAADGDGNRRGDNEAYDDELYCVGHGREELGINN